ncbi:acyl-CoA dehydrogenase family protein [Actinoallomurus iriomotensis]|uniref:Acyl-CoA dehydrogenase n=1 Tax=Actinoallomurus iriomotensis TaxID=478107 RepID=A0A9W6VTI0_9ACTN|nr:acyl-CoA dehydrogenase family protein [Actinoallomurus iriomotensis]GLY84503.1 acyl-CoA dehydrogenase [Actinoallomurus iriomotensis]
MDFDLDENAQELRSLVSGLLDREATPARIEEHERSGAPYDARLWAALAQAGVLGACLPEDLGGAGLGAVELAVILREIGAHAAPVPAYASLPAALTIARHGGGELRARLGVVADGGLVLTAAVREPGSGLAQPPGATATPDGDAYVLEGVKTFVPYAGQAAYILVPARTGDGTVGVFAVEPDQVALTPQPAATGEPMARLDLDGVRVGAGALLGAGAHETLLGYATAGAVATASGALAAALDLTTGHVRTREQFGRPLAEFQAVTMQIGDVYIAKRALDVAMWAGVWRLAEGHDDAAEVLAVAAWAACEGALQALYTCQHLHGGLGLDVTYPLHRHFAWGKHYAHLLGGAEAQLDTIGALVA